MGLYVTLKDPPLDDKDDRVVGTGNEDYLRRVKNDSLGDIVSKQYARSG